MKQRTLVALLALVIMLSAQGCVGVRTIRGSGRVVEEERPVSGFTSVELATLGNLYIEMGDEEKLRIEAEDNIIRYLEVEVRDGRLKIDSRDGVNLLPKNPVYFYLTVRELDTVELSGVGHIEVPDLTVGQLSVITSGVGDIEMEDLDADTVRVKISGAGDVEMEDLYADRLEVDISSLGNLSIAGGEVGEQDVTISGAGNYQARHLESAQAEVHLKSLGSVTIRVHDHLKVNISGAGSVRYVGSPTVEQDVSGLGHVEQIGD